MKSQPNKLGSIYNLLLGNPTAIIETFVVYLPHGPFPLQFTWLLIKAQRALNAASWFAKILMIPGVFG
jgi:hypothetical protein